MPHLLILIVFAVVAAADVRLLVTLHVFRLVRSELRGEINAMKTNHSPKVNNETELDEFL
jgi:hypothetical protein